MKPYQQFFALYRYNAFASPWIWMFPLAFGLQPCIALMFRSTWGSLSGPLAPMTMMSFLPMMAAAFVFAGEKFFTGTPGLTPQTQQQIQTFAGDFLLTRAVDRPVIFKSRVALYWTMILLPFVILMTLTAARPELSIEMPLKAPTNADFYLAHLPGAEVTKTTKSTQVITSPHGRVALAGVIALLGASGAAFWQVMIYAILPLRFRKWIFWSAFLVLAFLPILIIGDTRSTIGSFERLALWIMHYPMVSGIIVGALIVAGFVFCAARDREVEYP